MTDRDRLLDHKLRNHLLELMPDDRGSEPDLQWELHGVESPTHSASMIPPDAVDRAGMSPGSGTEPAGPMASPRVFPSGSPVVASSSFQRQP